MLEMKGTRFMCKTPETAKIKQEIFDRASTRSGVSYQAEVGAELLRMWKECGGCEV